jgi:hypothetical protein
MAPSSDCLKHMAPAHQTDHASALSRSGASSGLGSNRCRRPSRRLDKQEPPVRPTGGRHQSVRVDVINRNRCAISRCGAQRALGKETRHFRSIATRWWRKSRSLLDHIQRRTEERHGILVGLSGEPRESSGVSVAAHPTFHCIRSRLRRRQSAGLARCWRRALRCKCLTHGKHWLTVSHDLRSLQRLPIRPAGGCSNC